MQIRRTANAGVLLTLDDVSILLDGVCRVYPPFLAPPPAVVEELAACPPDALAFTHAHPDHFDTDFTARFQRHTGNAVLGTEMMERLLPDTLVTRGHTAVGGVMVTPYPSRHLGVEWQDYEHVSYLLEGSRRVFFVGDTAPIFWGDEIAGLRPDVLIAPYPYVVTSVGWRTVQRFAPKAVVLVHMPGREFDPDGIWPMVERALKSRSEIPVWVPELGETIRFP